MASPQTIDIDSDPGSYADALRYALFEVADYQPRPTRAPRPFEQEVRDALNAVEGYVVHAPEVGR